MTRRNGCRVKFQHNLLFVAALGVLLLGACSKITWREVPYELPPEDLWGGQPPASVTIELERINFYPSGRRMKPSKWSVPYLDQSASAQMVPPKAEGEFENPIIRNWVEDRARIAFSDLGFQILNRSNLEEPTFRVNVNLAVMSALPESSLKAFGSVISTFLTLATLGVIPDYTEGAAMVCLRIDDTSGSPLGAVRRAERAYSWTGMPLTALLLFPKYRDTDEKATESLFKAVIWDAAALGLWRTDYPPAAGSENKGLPAPGCEWTKIGPK